MLAAHFENLLFLLLIAVALLFQLLTRTASKIRKASEDSEDEMRRSISTAKPIRRTPAETDEERIRRFLEALGQPTTTIPPPPVVPRTDIPPRPVAPVQPPPVLFPPTARQFRPIHEQRRKNVVVSDEGDVGAPGEWLREINYPHGIPEAPYEKGISKPRVAESLTFEVHEGAPPAELLPIVKTPAQAYAAAIQPSPKLPQRKTEIADLLTSTSGLRNAIILREIFGPPRSLQSLDLVVTA
jgi:hypothetical protein